MMHLQELDKHFLNQSCNDVKEELDSHCVQYTAAYSTLVHNPEGVRHFCNTVKSLATNGCVDIQTITGMAESFENKAEAGFFVSVNAYIPV